MIAEEADDAGDVRQYLAAERVWWPWLPRVRGTGTRSPTIPPSTEALRGSPRSTKVVAVSRSFNVEDGRSIPAHVGEMGIAFEEFFDHERDRLFRVLCVMTANRHEAEELAQDAFLKVLERWDRVRAMEDPAGYLHRAAMNEFRKRYRRSKVALRRILPATSPPDVFEAVHDRDLTARALSSLTPRQRAALVLTEALSYSAEEAGQLLGIKASTVRALTSQARDALRKSEGGAIV
jgi:RNA polymerase sigma factor (sigma-70 family)